MTERLDAPRALRAGAAFALCFVCACGGKDDAPAPAPAPDAPAVEAPADAPPAEPPAPSPEPTPEGRTLTFPADRSLGEVKIYDLATAQWKTLGDARGVVPIPESGGVSLSVSQEGIADLSPLADIDASAVDAVTLAGLEVPEEQLAHLKHLTSLGKLSLRDSKVSDAAMAKIAELASLRELDLSLAPVGDEGVALLKTLPNLEYLDISYTKATDASIPALLEFPTLNYLDPQRSAITEEGVEKMREANPALTIVIR